MVCAARNEFRPYGGGLLNGNGAAMYGNGNGGLGSPNGGGMYRNGGGGGSPVTYGGSGQAQDNMYNGGEGQGQGQQGQGQGERERDVSPGGYEGPYAHVQSKFAQNAAEVRRCCRLVFCLL